MGISYTLEQERPIGVQANKIVEATFSGAYTAGGEPLNPSDVNLGKIEGVTVMSVVTNSGYVIRHNRDAGTLQAYESPGVASSLTEVAGGTDLTGEGVRLTVKGRS